MAASADPNRAIPEPSSGSSDDANGRPDRSYSCVQKFFYWAILDARSGAGLAREVILYFLLSI